MAKISNFQASVITFLVCLKSDKSCLDNLAHIFKNLDKNKDGHLSRKEIREGIEANHDDVLFNFGKKQQDYDELFSACDANHDGAIDYDEFIRAGYSRSKLINLRNLKIAFDSIDFDGDGSIDI